MKQKNEEYSRKLTQDFEAQMKELNKDFGKRKTAILGCHKKT